MTSLGQSPTLDLTAGRRRVITVAILVGIFLSASEATIVATAMPVIVGRLGGIGLYAWVFTAFLLTSTTAVPIFGKLADQFGRKPIYLIAITIFLVGSALCGLATSMEQLVLFRAIQGIGAGGLQPLAFTIIGDIFTIQERARIQGIFSAIWGLASFAAPAMGGLIVDNLAWQYIFWLNVPIGLVTMALVWYSLRERFERRGWPVIDYLGSITLIAMVGLLQFALLDFRGNSLSPEALVMLVGVVVLFGVFLFVERRAASPVLPLELFRNPIILYSGIGAVALGAVVLSLTNYLPVYLQGALGTNATEAGIILIPFSVGWTIGSTVAGRLFLTLGFRIVASAGAATVAAACLGLAVVPGIAGFPLFVDLTVLGIGSGFAFSAFTISTQTAVGWSQRGVATSTTQFARQIGGTLGVAVLGAVLTAQLATRLAGVPGATAGIANQILDPRQREAISPEVLAAARDAIGASMGLIFFLVFCLAVITLIPTLRLPPGRPESEHRR